MLFSTTIYRKFILASVLLFLIYIVAIFYFIHQLREIHYDFESALDGINVLQWMCSDSSIDNTVEFWSIMLMIFGFACLIVQSNSI